MSFFDVYCVRRNLDTNFSLVKRELYEIGIGFV